MILLHNEFTRFLYYPKNYYVMFILYGTWDLSLVEMLLVDSQRKHANHGNNIISSILITVLINLTHLPRMFSLKLYFIADTISCYQQCSVSHTLSLFLSLRSLALSPAQDVWYKTLAFISTLSLISINWFDPHHCFT